MQNKSITFVCLVVVSFFPTSLWAQEAYTVVKDGIITFYYDNNKTGREGNVYDIATEYVGDGNYPAWRSSGITKAVFDSSFSNYFPTCTARWFHSCSGLTEIENISYLNTELSTSMGGMFYDCNSLLNIDLSGFRTSNVTTMFCMFYGCSKLERLDLSSFDTGNVRTMAAMFYGCTSLKELNVSSFDTKNVENLEYLFFNCTHLLCLDISSFNTGQTTNMEAMFAYCENLQTIYVGYGWNTEKVTISKNMFWGCDSLVGGDGTKCDGYGSVNPIDFSFAKVDTSANPGYFTSDVNNVLSNTGFRLGYFYSPSGIRSIHPRKGLNINNGKKMIMR